MGRELARLLSGQGDITLVAGIEAPGHPELRAGDVPVLDSLDALSGGCDVVVDFSAPGPMVEHARHSVAAGRPFVTGVTGLSAEQTQALARCSESIALVHAPNFSVGVAALLHLAADAARLLGAEYDVEIIETHHREKRDAPSGTARLLGDALSLATRRAGVCHGRDGQVGPKQAGEIGVHAVRTGSVVGEHVVIFGGPGERLELTHRADSRQAFAAGVIRAIRFARSAPPGLYGMADVLAQR
jgi:4-hydroxy-tetrahydrodipicolinate reductase